MLFFIFSCEKDKPVTEKKSNDIQIAIGTACGWCGGNDSLLITNDKMYYNYNTPCDNKHYVKTSITAPAEWNNLLDLIALNDFQEININTCNVCADGCDTWISITNASFSHKIRFGYSDSAVLHQIQPFMTQLDSIRTQFRNKAN